MGRKAAPQPLTLSDPSSNAQSGNAGLAQDPRPGETLGQIHPPTSASTTTPSSAPKSPRSPFRFTPKKSLLGKSLPLYSPADDLQLQPSPSQSESQESPVQQKHTTGVNYSNNSQALSHHRPNHVDGSYDDGDDVESPFIPLAATLHGSLDSPASKGQGHGQLQPDDAARGSPKGSGFFFNFHKPSKSSQQLPIPTTAKSQHSNPDLVGEGLSRGTDNPAMPGKNSKYPGTTAPVFILCVEHSPAAPSPGFIYPP